MWFSGGIVANLGHETLILTLQIKDTVQGTASVVVAHDFFGLELKTLRSGIMGP